MRKKNRHIASWPGRAGLGRFGPCRFITDIGSTSKNNNFLLDSREQPGVGNCPALPSPYKMTPLHPPPLIEYHANSLNVSWRNSKPASLTELKTSNTSYMFHTCFIQLMKHVLIITSRHRSTFCSACSPQITLSCGLRANRGSSKTSINNVAQFCNQK